MDLQIAVEVREEIIELYQEGYALDDIAETFNYDPDYGHRCGHGELDKPTS